MMIAGAMGGGPLRIQEDVGPPWKDESARRVRMLTRDLRETLGLVLKMQHDIGVGRDILLSQLWHLAHGRVEDAQELVARARSAVLAH